MFTYTVYIYLSFYPWCRFASRYSKRNLASDERWRQNRARFERAVRYFFTSERRPEPGASATSDICNNLCSAEHVYELSPRCRWRMYRVKGQHAYKFCNTMVRHMDLYIRMLAIRSYIYTQTHCLLQQAHFTITKFYMYMWLPRHRKTLQLLSANRKIHLRVISAINSGLSRPINSTFQWCMTASTRNFGKNWCTCIRSWLHDLWFTGMHKAI
jgi:hypothetical protein